MGTSVIIRTIAAVSFLVLCAALFIGCGSRSGSGSAPSSAGTETATAGRGDEIVAEFLRREDAPFRKQRVRFTVAEESEPLKVYEIDSWRKKTNASTLTMTEIISPTDDKGLGSLTIEENNKSTVVVTYAQSRGEFRETDTNKMFFGGLTGGELLGEWAKFDYRYIGEKDIAGVKTWEVEAKLKPDINSIASKMTINFRTDTYQPAELHLFDPNGREIRIYRIVEFKNVGDKWYAAKTDVENPVYKARITIEILSREYPASIEDAIFSRERLKQISGK